MTVREKRLNDQRLAWRARNRGRLAEIAKSLGLSAPFVSDVFYGRRISRNQYVENALADAGAPGFRKEEQA